MPDNRRVSVGITADISGFQRGLAAAAVEARTFSHELESADGRMANLVQSGLALAPALVPLGAAAVPAVAGLATQLGLAAAAAGVAVLAFHGVGDALKALDTYQTQPTTQNFAKLNEALDKIGPAGQQFVLAVDQMKPKLQELQDAAQAGLLPGVTEGLEDLIRVSPQVEQVITTISSTLGDLARDSGASLAGPGVQRFFDYLQHTARPVLTEMGQTFGNFLQGIANTIIAFDPLSRSFSTGLLDISKSFEQATERLSSSSGFQDFLTYVQESGPRALDALESIGNAFIQLIEAAAPVGSAVLPVVSALADALAAIANSPAGPAIIGAAAAVGTLGRSLALLKAVGLRGENQSMIGRALGLGDIEQVLPWIREAQAATRELAAAQEQQRAKQISYLATLRASSAQVELVPGYDPSKNSRAATAVDELATANKRVATASAAAAEAEERKATALSRSRSAGLRATGVIAGLAVANSDYAQKSGLSNTASLALMGTIAGPWGAAIGGGVGLVEDLASANNDLESAMKAVDRASTYSDQVTALSALKAQTDDYTKSVDRAGTGASKWLGVLGGSSPGDQIRLLSDRFTGSGDEAETSLRKQTRAVADAQSAYRALAQQIGEPLPADASPAQIQAFADKVTPTLQRAGISVKDFTNGSWSGLQRAVTAYRDYEQSTSSAAAQTQQIANVMLTTKLSADQLASSLDAVFSPKLSRSEAADQMIKSLRTLNSDLKQGSTAGLSRGSDVGLANRDAVRQRVQAVEASIKADADAGASSDQLVRKLQRGRQAILDQGEAAGISRSKMAAYLRTLGLTPQLVRTLLKLDGANKAKSDGQSLLDKLHQLTNFTATPHVSVVGADKAVSAVASVGIALNNLDGKTATTYERTVKKKAEGGAVWGRVTGPGGPTDDRVPILASNGEWVMKAAAVNFYGPRFMDDVNAMRFASGGQVRRPPVRGVEFSSAAPAASGGSGGSAIAYTGVTTGDGSSQIPGYDAAQATLAILQAQQQIRQIVHDLNERVKKGPNKGKFVIRGANRDEKEAELQAAQLELTYLQHKTDADAAAQAAQDAIAATEQRNQAISSAADALSGTFSLTGRGTSANAIENNASRFELDVANYVAALQALIGAGAGYGVLKNVEAIADSGDFRTAARVAKNLASNPVALGNTNSRLYEAQQLTTQIATLTQGAAFQQSNAGIQGLTIPLNFLQDPSYVSTEIGRQLRFILPGLLSQAAAG